METVQSLDIFDTIVTRDVFKPSDIFYFVGKNLQKSGILNVDPTTFQRLRIEAERLTRKTSKYEDVTLDEIYDTLASILNLSKDLIESLKETEILSEKEALVPISENLGKISENTILISDIYFDGKTIADFLRNVGVTTYKELFVSSEYRKTKSSGRLYEIITQKYHVERHIGDNEKSDFEVPQRMGIPARLYKESWPSRYENAIYADRRLPYELRSVLAGTMKAARLSKHYENEHLQTIHEVATNVIGPFLFFYVYWVLESASKLDLERLYFFAREGQILKSIADVLTEAFNIKIETRYLYVSRRALFLPSLINESDIDEMLKLLESPNLKHGLVELGVLEANDHIFNMDSLRRRILKMSEQKRSILLGYLKQEGFAPDLKIGVVDIGWKGRLQLCLSKVLDYGGLYNSIYGIIGFYVGISPTTAAPAYKSDKRMRFFSEKCWYLLGAYTPLHETFAAATHGLTVGYKKENGKFRPILKDKKNVELLKWGLGTQQRSIRHFVGLFVKNISKYDVKLTHFQEIAEALLNLFLRSPTKREALTYGKVVHRSDVGENEPRYIAAPSKPSDVMRHLFQIRSKGFLTPEVNPFWIEGTAFASLPYYSAKFFLSLLYLRRLARKFRMTILRK
ncbi:MAG: hypothetical protein QW791_09455 [Candidatus Bathyarchaeia archaeon]